MLNKNHFTRHSFPSCYSLAVMVCIILSLNSSIGKANSDFVGVAQCKTCHVKEYKQWENSDHDWAMRIADESSVLGDFNNAKLNHFGSMTRFYRKDGTYFVKTENSKGQLEEFRISYTFGFFPLQQYLIKFPDGRYQALSVAWDSRSLEAGGQRWFHLYPNEAIPHNDVLHWTGTYFNWNSRCAACHSTNLERHYNAEKDTYQTTWSDINVSCEACHGPGIKHVEWANQTPDEKIPYAGFSASLSPVGEWLKTDDKDTAAHQGMGNERQVAACGSCHARRTQLTEPMQAGVAAVNFHDHFQLALLDASLYYPDGQIKDEVFEMSSFIQSKMFHKGVACSNCHEPHSLKLRKEGNLVCTQCHSPQVFDGPSHHHHPVTSTGAQCANCHMPKTAYMVIDQRADHSIRIPRPDLSDQTGAPNACTNCHQQESNQWATNAVQSWLASSSKKKQAHYSDALAAAHTDSADAQSLINLVENPDIPGIVRASAVQLLPKTTASLKTAQKQLGDPDPLLRMSAVSFFDQLPKPIREKHILPALSDKKKIVRLEAARVLADSNLDDLDVTQKSQLQRAFKEYVEVQQANADTHEAQINLGIFYSRQGLFNEAQRHYRKAMKLAPAFPASYLNSADIYREIGEEKNAESVLQNGIANAPKTSLLHYSLALNLVRQKRYADAEHPIEKAFLLENTNETYLQIYVTLLDHLGKTKKAVDILNHFSHHNQASPTILKLQKKLELKTPSKPKETPAPNSAIKDKNGGLIILSIVIASIFFCSVIFYLKRKHRRRNEC